LLAGAAVLLAALGGGVAWAADTIRSSALSNTYAQRTYDMAAGEIPTFTNETAGGIPHDVAAVAKGPDGKFLFKSRVIGSNRSTPVSGAQYLAPGSYPFFCTIHGRGMSATLRVGPGNQAPRPRIDATVPSQRIGAVRRSGKLLVRLAAAGSAASGAALVARVGRTTIGRKRGIAVPEGASRQLRISLSRRGRAALAGRDQALVKVTATVPFGRSDVARRLLD
jgi:plastocyanin